MIDDKPDLSFMIELIKNIYNYSYRTIFKYLKFDQQDKQDLLFMSLLKKTHNYLEL